MTPELSILICTLPERGAVFQRIQDMLQRQMVRRPVEVLFDRTGKSMSIGAKRNLLLKRATGKYVAFIDDDDSIHPSYVALILDRLKQSPDCVELRGTMTTNGVNPKQFIHTISCTHWHEKNGIYYRMPNHLNAIKRELALQAGFPEKSFGEDHDFSKRVQPLLKTEAPLDIPIYYYLYRTTK